MRETKPRSRSVSGPFIDSMQLEELEELLPANAPDVGSVIAKKYRIERLIARGGMGAVYAATHLVSGKRVALKWMLPTLGQIAGARERFIGEACATARIDHPNIVDIYDVGNDAGSIYLVMEYLHGETLSDRMERDGLTPEQAISLLMPAFRGVAAAHAHGVIHRDLKPENIFLCCTAEGEPLEPKVLDFGISKISGVESQNHSLTRSGAVLGTPYYMSPEQVRGARDVDERADVYAFGVMLYEALTGQRPFDAETYNQLILKIATETPEPMHALNPLIDEKLIAIVERAMVRDPALRFPSIESLALALEPFGAGARFRSAGSAASAWPLSRSMPALPVPAVLPVPPAAPSARAASQHRRARTTVTSAVVALVLCSLGFWWLHGTRSDSSDARARSAHRVQPAAPRAPIAPDALPIRDPALPLTAATETTTSAASIAPNDALRRRNHGQSTKPRLVPTNVSHPSIAPLPPLDKSANEGPTASKRALLADWDDHLATAPARSSSAPAGHIDERDFR